MSENRIDGRAQWELRPLVITTGVSPYAEGSVQIECGRTKVLVCASLETEVPSWMKEGTGGWITAEYGMLPRATHTRNKRESAQGKQSGRTLEIQRLIGRALRAAIDLKRLPALTVRVDCDVICADGGTRTAAITGAWVALAQSIQWAKAKSLVPPEFELKQVAAVSLGVVKGIPMIDLCYEEDSKADFDMNVVLDSRGRLIEVQGTAEKDAISSETLSRLLVQAENGIQRIMEIQRESVRTL